MEEIKKDQSITIFNNYESSSVALSAYTHYAVPTFETTYNKKYVKWLDSDGKTQWPDRLIEYKNNSALHGRICKSIIHQICGAGFIYDTNSPKARATEEFLNKENANGKILYEVFKEFVSDEYIIGMGSLLLQYELNKKSIFEVQHIPMDKLRAAPIDSLTNKVPGWWYMYDWSKQPSTKSNLMTFIAANDFKETKSLADQYDDLIETMDVNIPEENLKQIESLFGTPNIRVLIHAPSRDTASFYYPSLPVYIGGLSAIRTSISVGRYNINSIENGLNVDSVMMVYGMNSDAAKLKFANEFNAQYRNPNRGKQSVILFPSDPEMKPEINNLNTNSEDRLYTRINDNIIQEIIFAHGITSPLLVAVRLPGSLGGSTEQEDAAERFYQDVIKPLQFQMLEPINKIMKYNDLEELVIDRLNVSDTQTPETDESK